MTVVKGPLQEVPDIDDLTEESKDKAKPNTSEKSDFEQTLSHAHVLLDSKVAQPKKIQWRRGTGVQPPIQRVAQDAQPLTSQEIRTHRHLLQS